MTEIPVSSSDTSGRGHVADPHPGTPAGSSRIVPGASRPAARVVLLGAGPGDAALLTTRGRELLAQADVVVVNPGGSVPQLPEASAAPVAAPVTAEVIEAPGPAAETARACAQRAARGALVVRLFPGDPFIG
ncbi:MAG: SAM-dependent methyltransferase, partial [Frankiaceae bacterium]